MTTGEVWTLGTYRLPSRDVSLSAPGVLAERWSGFLTDQMIRRGSAQRRQSVEQDIRGLGKLNGKTILSPSNPRDCLQRHSISLRD